MAKNIWKLKMNKSEIDANVNMSRNMTNDAASTKFNEWEKQNSFPNRPFGPFPPSLELETNRHVSDLCDRHRAEIAALNTELYTWRYRSWIALVILVLALAALWGVIHKNKPFLVHGPDTSAVASEWMRG